MAGEDVGVSGPDRRATLRPVAAGGGGQAARLVRKQGRPGSPTSGAPATITGGGVSPV
jgi:hypothetical protein